MSSRTEITLSDQTPYHKALMEVKNGAQSLSAAQRLVGEIAAPHTITGKGKKLLANLVPGLRDVLEARPLQEVKAGLRDTILKLYSNMKELLNTGNLHAQECQRLEELVIIAETSKDETEVANAVSAIRQMIMEKAQKELGLRPDSETEELMSKFRASQGKSADTIVVNQARQIVEFSKPAVQTAGLVLQGAVATFDSLIGTYVLVTKMQPLAEAVTDTAHTINRGVNVGVTAFQTLTGQLEVAVASAQNAVRAAELLEQVGTAVTANKLKAVSSELENFDPAGNIQLLGKNDNSSRS